MNEVPTVALVNQSSVVTQPEVEQAAVILQYQVHYHFRPYWGQGAKLVVVPQGEAAPAGSWVMAILDDSDQAGALGYHDVTADGTPLAKVFARTDQQYGLSWTVTTSHELVEMLADPQIDRACQAPSGRFWALEVGDPVEADSDGYLIQGVLVSNFVTPAWFGTGNGRYDYRGLLSQPTTLRPGGYASYWNGHGWSQTTADGAPAPPDPDHLEARGTLHPGRNRVPRRPEVAAA